MKDKEPKLSRSHDEQMSLIGSLALILHMNHPEVLSCDLPVERPKPFKETESEHYLIDGNTVRFASIEARNRCVATYEFEKNRTESSVDLGMWLKAAHELWRCEIGKSDSAAGRLLALAHERNDIFSIAASAIENKSMQVFDVLHVLEAALPYLQKLEPNEIIKLCATQHEQTKDDLFSSNLFNELQKCFRINPLLLANYTIVSGVKLQSQQLIYTRSHY